MMQRYTISRTIQRHLCVIWLRYIALKRKEKKREKEKKRKKPPVEKRLLLLISYSLTTLRASMISRLNVSTNIQKIIDIN